jgi:uncharacterized protein YutE (UPF0331/DUF86 family)
LTNIALVSRKLAVLDEHLRRLTERRPATAAALRNDTLVQDALAMGVMVIVQEAMDIALHLAADNGWEIAPTYREAFAVLARHAVISAELAASLGGGAQLRNRIAHGYATVDVDRLWNELPSGVASFGAFSQAVAAFLLAPPR